MKFVRIVSLQVNKHRMTVTASEMTYTVSGEALNSAQFNPIDFPFDFIRSRWRPYVISLATTAASPPSACDVSSCLIHSTFVVVQRTYVMRRIVSYFVRFVRHRYQDCMRLHPLLLAGAKRSQIGANWQLPQLIVTIITASVATQKRIQT